MNEVVVNDMQMPEIKTWNGHRVVTFKDIDLVHNRTKGTARRNFNTNKKHFIENEDYYLATKEQINVRNSYNGHVPSKGVTLLTESGYLMIVKSFNDDLSWDVQRRLVNSYFKANDNNSLTTNSPALAKNTRTWYDTQKWKMEKLCADNGWERKYLYHKILREITDVFSLDFFKESFYDKYHYEAKYDMEIVNEFPELQEVATKYLDFLLDIMDYI